MSAKVSIIIPCFNQAQFLGDALSSIVNQSYSNWECIIVNDGSTDDTKFVIKEWLNRDKRFKYLEQNNKGVSVARNVGIDKSEGIYILPLDADDKISSNYLKLAIEIFYWNPELKLVYSRAEKFGDQTGEWYLPKYSLNLLAQENVIFSSGVYKKEDWEVIGGYDEAMVSGLEDWDFWISLLKEGGEVFRINEVCFFYRISSNSRNNSLKVSDFENIYKYLNKKHFDFIMEELGSSISLNNRIKKIEKKHCEILKNKKFVLKLVYRTFFNFSLSK